MDKKVLLGIVGAVFLVAGWAAFGMPGFGERPEDPDTLVEDASEEETPRRPATGDPTSRRLDVLDLNDLPVRQVSVYADTAEGVVRLKGGSGWVRLPVTQERPTPAAALADGRWSALSEIHKDAEEDALLRTTAAAGHLRLQVRIEGLEQASEPWVEIHPVGDDGLAAAARLYLDVLSAGSFRFRGGEGEIPIQDLPPAAYQLEIGHAGCPSIRMALRIQEGQTEVTPVTLQQGATLHGQVQTPRPIGSGSSTSAQATESTQPDAAEPDGPQGEGPQAEGEASSSPFAPVPGAVVALWPVGSNESGWEDPLTPFRIYGTLPPRIPEQERARSDARGQVRMVDIPPGRYHLLVHAEGYRPLVSPESFTLSSGETLEIPALLVQAGVDLPLLLESEAGQPVAGAEVRWQLRPPSGRPLTQDSGSRTSLSDERGGCRLRGLPQGDLWLQVKHPQFAVLETRASLTAEARETPLKLTLFEGRDLEGQVLDLASGEPLADVQLKLLPQVGSAASASAFPSSYDTDAVSDAQGAFVFHSLPPDTYLLLAHHEAYASSLSGPIPVDAEHTTPTILLLSPGATLEVELLDDEGFPAPQEWVLVLSEEPESFTRARTDDQGIARFQHLAAGTYKVMHAESVAAATSTEARLHRDYEYTSLLDLDRRRVLLGGKQVLSSLEGFLLHEGRPAPGRRIVLLADDGTRIATTDASGFYQFQDLVPGSYLFQVTGAQGPAGGSFYGSAMVSADPVVQRDILLPSADLEVRVVDAASGKPIPYLPIILRPADGTDIVGGQIQATDSQGLVRFETLRDGEYLVCAGDAATPFYGGEGQYGAEIRRIHIRSGEDDAPSLELRAPRGATLMAHVEDQQGRPLEGVHLHYQDAEGNVLNQVSLQGTNARGDGTLKGLPSGPGFLIARHPSLGAQRVPIDLVPGQRSRRTLRLEPGITLHAQVVDADGRPAPGVMVRLFDGEGKPVGNLQSTMELQEARLAYLRGTAQKLGPLQPGTYRLMLHRPGEEPVEQVLTLVDGSQDAHRRLTY